MPKMRECPDCGADVAAANFERHQRRVHGAEGEVDRRRVTVADRRRRHDKDKPGLLPLVAVIVLASAGIVGVLYFTVLKPGESPFGGGGGGGGDYAVLEISIGGSAAGTIKWKLRPDAAPKTVAQIKSLIARPFFDGLTFHRVVKGFVIQGGDPKGDGTGGSGTNIPWEDSPLKNLRGTVAMARGQDINSADSQFFINLADNANLDKGGSGGQNQYVVFAEVVSGMDVVERIANVPVNGEKPTSPVVMTSVRLATS